MSISLDAADLSSILGEGERNRRQMIVGGGALRFFGINIYTVGMYVDAQKAAKSPELQKFRGMSAESLRKDQSFYEAMVSKDDLYDRSIWIKLLIPIKASLVKKNLEVSPHPSIHDDWHCRPLARIMLSGDNH